MSAQQKITIEDLEKLVPSAFTTSRYAKASEKYQVANTSEIIKSFVDSGWNITKATQAIVNDSEKNGYQFHSIRMRNPEIKLSNNDSEFMEIEITNGHDTNHLLTISMGIYRQVCSNGLVIGYSHIEPVRMRHVGTDFQFDLNQAINYINAKTEDVKALIEQMRNTELTQREINKLAKDMFELRMEKKPTKVQLEEILTPNREEDEGNGLWEKYNTLQENIVKGNFTYIVKKMKKKNDPEGTEKLATYNAKPILSAQKLLNVNSKMFDISMKLAK